MDVEEEYRLVFEDHLQSLTFTPKPCTTIELQYDNTTEPIFKQEVKSDDELKAWVHTPDDDAEHKLLLRLIFCDQPRPEEVPNDIDKITRVRAIIAQRKRSKTLPFEQKTFIEIVNKWCLPRTIVKAILRNGASYSRPMRVLNQVNGSIMQLTCPEHHDLILALSWDLAAQTIYGIVIGCTEAEAARMSRFFEFSTTFAEHPLLALISLAEVQKERLASMYLRNCEDFAQNSVQEAFRSGAPDLANSMTNYTKLVQGVMSSFEKTGHLVVNLQHFRAQLNKAIIDIDIQTLATEPTMEEQAILNKRRFIERLNATLDGVDGLIESSRVQNRQASLLMSALWNLVAQRDNLISRDMAKESKKIAEQARLLTLRGVELSQETHNITIEAKGIADATKRDSTSMVAIATLTMFFLPLTFVASFLAMPIFDWQAKEPDKIVNPSQIAIYGYAAGSLTAVVVSVWGCWLWYSENQRKRKNKVNTTEKLPVHSAKAALSVAMAPLDTHRSADTPDAASAFKPPAAKDPADQSAPSTAHSSPA